MTPPIRPASLGDARTRGRVAIGFVTWMLLGSVPLGFVIDRLIPDWEGADVLRQSGDLLRAFHNWDAGHYMAIARDGYAVEMDRAYFPLFPLLLRGFMAVFGDPAVAGLVLTTLLSGLFALAFYVFVSRRLSERHAVIALVGIVAMPSAFFLHCIYAEPLFCLLLVLFLSGFMAQSWSAGLFAVLLTLTRGQGVFLGIAVALILAGEAPAIWRARDRRRACYLVGIGGCFAAGTLAFMAFQHYAFGDALAFVHMQTKYFGGHGNSLANSFRPGHVIALLVTPPLDWNGPQFGLIDQLCIFASIALAPVVWRFDRRLFAFYFCLAYFPATMGYGGAYFRYFLLPYCIAAVALAHSYLDGEPIGTAKKRVAAVAVAVGLTLQVGLSLLHAAHRWVG